MLTMWGRMASCGRLAIGLFCRRVTNPPQVANLPHMILPIILIAAANASVPVRDSCSDDATVVANVQESDAIQIRHAVAGESLPCYAVSVMQASGEVRGYIVTNALPVIQEFERRRALESRVPMPAPPEPAPGEEKAAVPMTPVGPPFEPWSGVDSRGKRFQIAQGRSKVTLVTFWSVESGTARRYVENLRKTESEFRPRGLSSFGFMEAASAGRANFYMDDMGLEAPQALDREKLAAKYNADTRKGTTLVLDASNQVVAISSNPVEIRATVARLLSLK
jgi:hypothetical protein